jgi:hypothetical protein
LTFSAHPRSEPSSKSTSAIRGVVGLEAASLRPPGRASRLRPPLWTQGPECLGMSFPGKGSMARRAKGAYPLWSVTGRRNDARESFAGNPSGGGPFAPELCRSSVKYPPDILPPRLHALRQNSSPRHAQSFGTLRPHGPSLLNFMKYPGSTIATQCTRLE